MSTTAPIADWNDTPQAIDPIIALMQTYTRDERADRANLGIGVYQDRQQAKLRERLA